MANNAQQNLNLVKKLFDELYSKGNFSFADEVFANDLKVNDAAIPNFRGGLNAYKERERMYKAAFPNKVAKIDDIMATEDGRVIVRWTVHGTHKGELQDIPASGKPIKVQGISIYRFANGKIIEISQVWDRLGLLEQVGVVEPSMALHQ